MVQRRTLFLQRTVSTSAALKNKTGSNDSKAIGTLTQRLAEIEAQIAGSVLLPTSSHPASPSADELSNGKPNPQTIQPASIDDVVKHASDQASTELRRTFQPDLDALNRAMRRYEKRSTVSTIQVETRLQDLESKIQDVVVLAAAAQRNVDRKYGQYAPVLLDWMSMCVVAPILWGGWVVSLPGRMVGMVSGWVRAKLGFATADSKGVSRGGKDGRGERVAVVGAVQGGRQRSREKKGKV